DDALRVREIERARDADEQLEERFGRDGAFAPELLVHAFAFEELEHEEGRSVFGLPEIEDLDDALASNAAARLGLVEEALERDRVFGHVGANDLERDVAIDQLVPRGPDGAARPRAEEPLEAVARLDQIAGIQRSIEEDSAEGAPDRKAPCAACTTCSPRVIR